MIGDLAKLGHVAVLTPNMERSLWFFGEVLGLDEVERRDDVVYLRAWGEFEHHSLSLREGPTGIDHIGWRASSADVVPAIAERLERNGTDVTWIGADEEAGQGRAIRFTPPTGHPFEIYYDIAKPPAPPEIRARLKSNQASASRRGLSPRMLDHVNLATTDPHAGQEWMREQLGFQLREAVQSPGSPIRGAWLAVTSQVHDLALIGDPNGLNGRFNHLSYIFDTPNDVMRGCDILRELDLPIELGPGMHGLSRSFYCYLHDPGSGHRVEMFSGGYHIFDPDWEPVVWTEDELPEAGSWWGPYYSAGPDNPTSTTTPCVVDSLVESANG
jgi:catechol 2,3-dioxygenase